ncbi:MAG: radical SAM protein [Chloroflexota bacterium]|nr:radical SAM protein [Chloroflexota bacterium]
MPDRIDEPPRIILRDAGQDCLVEGQCDACPPSVSLASLTDAPIPSSVYSLPDTFRTASVADGYWVAYAPKVSAGPAVLNDQALALLRYFEHPRTLHTALADQGTVWGAATVEDVMLKMQKERLLVPTPCPEPYFIESAQTLVAWLHVTQACNLRCSYCYLDAAPEAMSPEVCDRAIDAIFHSATIRRLSGVKLKYAGGEPTLVFPLIAHLHRRAARLAKEHSLKLDGVIISNGVNITWEMVETMQALGLRLTVSLDGLQTYHDCQRHFADGTGSFQSVSRTIDHLLEVGLTPAISITVTDRNLPGLPALVQWVLGRDLPFSLNFYRETDLSASQRDLHLDEQRMIETMRAVFQVIKANLPRRNLLASLVDRANLACPHSRTCSVGTNYLVIDTRGRIAKCQMDIGHTVTDVYADDPLADIQADQTGIQSLPVDEKEECRECEWRYWCGGGCPLEAHRTTGRWDVKSPHCNIYKALFPEVLRLEGLRLLKHKRNRTA